MPSIYKDDRSPFSPPASRLTPGKQTKQSKKTTAIADKELAKLPAVKFEEPGRGALDTINALPSR